MSSGPRGAMVTFCAGVRRMHEDEQHDEPEPAEDQRARHERIRRWYDEALALGISEEDFYRQMMPIVGIEEIDQALDDPVP